MPLSQRPRWSRSFLRITAAVAIGGCAAAGSAATRPTAELPLALRVDYLPNLIYDGECLTFCGSVVNPNPEKKSVRVSCSLATSSRPDAGMTTQDLVAPARDEISFEMGWRLVRLADVIAFRVALHVGDKIVQRAKFFAYPASLELPELGLADNFLVDGDGDRAVLVVRRQARDRASRWALAKWARRTFTSGKVDARSALFIGDQLSNDENASYLSALKASDVMAENFSVVGVAHPRQGDRAGHAILRTLCAFRASALKRRFDVAVFFVGSEEARFGTDVDEFRRALDLMCGLLRSRGCKLIGFVAPVAPRALEGRVVPYRRAMHAVARTVGARVCNPQPAAARAGWGTGRDPGPDASRALADEILRFVGAETTK